MKSIVEPLYKASLRVKIKRLNELERQVDAMNPFSPEYKEKERELENQRAECNQRLKAIS